MKMLRKELGPFNSGPPPGERFRYDWEWDEMTRNEVERRYERALDIRDGFDVQANELELESRYTFIGLGAAKRTREQIKKRIEKQRKRQNETN